MSKKEVIRKCIGCSKLIDRAQMVKITRDSNTREVFVNPNSKIFGRSVYLCYNNLCIENALKKNRLAKLLKTSLTDEFKDKLKSIVEGKVYDIVDTGTGKCR